MLKIVFVVLIGSMALMAQTTPQQGLSSNQPDMVVYKNANIIVRAGDTKTANTLIVKGVQILNVGNDLKIPAEAKVVDLKGAYVYPGFVEPYIRYGVPEPKKEKRERGPNPNTKRVGRLPWNAAIKAHRNSADEFNADEKLAAELRKLGFTIVQTNGLDGIFQGKSAVVSLAKGLPNNIILKNETAQFMSFNKGTSIQDYPSSLMGSIALIRQTFYDGQWYRSAWSAFNKNRNQKQPEQNIALEALQQVLSKSLPVVFAGGSYLDIMRAAEIADEFKLNFMYKGAGDEYKRLDDIKRLNSPLIIPVNFPQLPDVKNADNTADVSLGELKHWDSAPENPARLAEAGIQFAFTTDGLKKKNEFLKNVRLAVKRGLDKTTALKALTQTAAKIAGILDYAGSLEKGKRASFLISDRDIFEDDAIIQTVVVDGKQFEINPMPELDVRGDWQLSAALSSTNLSLKISGKQTAPTAKLLSDSTDLKISNFKINRSKITFSVSADTLGFKGITRFSGRVSDDKMQGKLVDADNKIETWQAAKTKDFQDEQKEKKTDKPEPALFATTYPDKAYGIARTPEQPDVVVIKNATIWTASQKGILENADIVIKKGKIDRVGKNLSIPSGAVTIDGEGLHVTPGIIDEHSHIAISRGVNEGTQAVTSEVRIGDVLYPDHIHIYRQLAGGVTTSQLLHGSANPIGGQAQVIKLRWGANAEGLKYKNAPPSIKFALGENVKQSNWGDAYRSRYPQTRMGVREIIRDAFLRARNYAEEQKKYADLSSSERAKTIPPRRDLELDALVEILDSKRFIHCHSYVQSEILMLMRLAEEFGFRIGTFTHILEGYKVASEMAEHGAMASTFADWWDYKFEVYEAIPYNTVLMADAGVVSSVNSDDAEMARRLNHEAAKAIKYGGMSKEEAIKLVTINPAKQLMIDRYTGSLEPGKEADFVIWNDDPLSVYASVQQTWIEGRKYFDIEQDIKLRDLRINQRAALIQKALRAGKSGDKKSKPSKKGKKIDRVFHCDDIYDFMAEDIR